MENGISIEQMLGMTMGQIQDLKDAQMKIQNVIDQQVESVKCVVEENKLDEESAQSILNQLN